MIDDIELADKATKMISKYFAAIPFGIHFCWGNHEYFRDLSKIHAAIANSSINLITNRSHLTIPGKSPLYLLGVDFPWGKNSADTILLRQKYLQLAMQDLPAATFNLLIAHHPDFIEFRPYPWRPNRLIGHEPTFLQIYGGLLLSRQFHRLCNRGKLIASLCYVLFPSHLINYCHCPFRTAFHWFQHYCRNYP